MAKIPSKFAQFAGFKSQRYTAKHYFFRRILISLFPYVENLLHFILSDFPVDFIKQFFHVSFGVSARF